jgi:alanyl aminopeptidase
MALADSLIGAFGNGSLPAAELYPMLEPMARSNVRQIATAPMDVLRFSARLVDEDGLTRLRAFSKRLYQPQLRRLGWTPRRNESSETALLRASVIAHMATFVEDRTVRRQAVQRAHRYLGYGRRGDGELHPDAVDANLVETVLEVAVQDGDDAFFDHMVERVFASDDARVRSELLGAIASARKPEHAAKARALALDERLRVNEIRNVLRPQSSMRETRDDTFTWLTENFDALRGRLEDGAARTPAIGSSFCSEEKATALSEFFASRIDSLPGGPRILANVLEGIRLCAAKVEAHRESAQGFFSR